MTYAEWIEQYVSFQEGRYVRGKCASATKAMVVAFPELRRVAGFAHVDHQWTDQHWWCVAPDGTVVDPTAEQFGQVGQHLVDYEELDLNDPKTRGMIPTGRCMDCGDPVYNGATFCNSECERSTDAYLQLA